MRLFKTNAVIIVQQRASISQSRSRRRKFTEKAPLLTYTLPVVIKTRPKKKKPLLKPEE
uniref:Uncharacterized protein n=1 Tax=Anguilla anguilla TaxID=7936 RepID=A0A0E9WGZ1_ANGAN